LARSAAKNTPVLEFLLELDLQFGGLLKDSRIGLLVKLHLGFLEQQVSELEDL
jgi:hypothetical protein